ncbi:MAG: ATP-binding protein, partial [Leptolyngbyaceae cyanobacterium SM1_3_5]|nr:ATP-binding protein [Leptolyngbyaceae cyanobacterium SM1_3_5]
ATFFRFWMAHDSYQAVSPIQSLIFITFVQYHRNTAGLAYTFFACAEPEEWAAMFAYADLTRLPEADFVVGSQCYGAYGHDWRVMPPDRWQELLVQREIAASQAVPVQATEPIVVLSQNDFAIAVKTALGQLAQPDLLAQSPLLRSRLVIEQTTKADKSGRIAALQGLLRSAIESLQSSPREAKLY